MAVQVGDNIPDVTLKIMGEKGPEDISTSDIFAGKKVVMFAVPGAFTPTCSAAHLPGFVANADKIKAKGVDSVVCLSVNDAFVMDAWGKGQNAEEIMMVGDGNGELTKAMGVEMARTYLEAARKYDMKLAIRTGNHLLPNGNMVEEAGPKARLVGLDELAKRAP